MFELMYGLKYATYSMYGVEITRQEKPFTEPLKGYLSFRHGIFNRRTPPIFLTNFTDTKNGRQIKSHGCDHRIADPYHTDYIESKEKQLTFSGALSGLHFIGDTTLPTHFHSGVGFLHHRALDYAYGLSPTGTTIVTTTDRLLLTGLGEGHVR